MTRHVRKILVLVVAACGLAATLVCWIDHAAAQRPVERQALYGQQPHLLERALAQIETAPDGQPQIYFVGFAGFGRQAVFKREVLAVRQLFDDRFRTRGRSVVLINHPSTLAEYPLANVGNLDRVLKRIGQAMDTSRDSLFLFLTSHGQQGKLAVNMPGLSLAQLRPKALKKMLDRSGIRNRVIVVSACHAGSFVPALADPHTLVIAAARADRSSFGCEDRRRWTYFGDAYFNQALRRETSFRRAFERAKRLISLWETRDRLVRSLPQIEGGEALTGH